MKARHHRTPAEMLGAQQAPLLEEGWGIARRSISDLIFGTERETLPLNLLGARYLEPFASRTRLRLSSFVNHEHNLVSRYFVS